MPTRKRVRSINPNVTNPGGGSAVTGNLAWGPDFGESGGSNGSTFGVGVNLSMNTISLANDKTVGVNMTMSDVALSGSKGIGVRMTGTVSGAPFWQSVETGVRATLTGTSLTANKPTGTVEGDLLIAFIGTAASAAFPSISAPAGWSFILESNANSAKATAFYKVAGASEPSSYTFTIGALAASMGIEIHRVNGVNSTTQIDAQAGDSVLAAALDPDPDSPSLTTTVANTLVFAFLAHDHAALSQTHTAVSGHVERTDFESNVLSTNICGMHSMTRVFAAAAATGTAEHNCTETAATDGAMLRIAIRPGTITLA